MFTVFCSLSMLKVLHAAFYREEKAHTVTVDTRDRPEPSLDSQEVLLDCFMVQNRYRTSCCVVKETREVVVRDRSETCQTSLHHVLPVAR